MKPGLGEIPAPGFLMHLRLPPGLCLIRFTVILISSACVHLLLNGRGSTRQMKKVEVASQL